MLVLVCFNALIFILLSALHVYWALGGQWASAVVVPTRPDGAAMFRPGAAMTLVVAGGLLGFALLTVANTGWLSHWLAPGFVTVADYVIAAVFLLRAVGDFQFAGFFKRVKDTAFAAHDTAYYTPLCVVLGLGSLVLALKQ